MSKTKEQEVSIKKAQYYAWFLGWKETEGLRGREFTDPVVGDLLVSNDNEEADYPKLTLEITRKEVKVCQVVEKKKGKAEKHKYPPILTKDITFASQVSGANTDIVACIFLGFNPQTNRAVHVHVYKCDSAETASILVDHFNQIIDLPEHQERHKQVEQDLLSKGQLARPSIIANGTSVIPPPLLPNGTHDVRNGSSLASDGRSTISSNSDHGEREPVAPPVAFTSVTEELQVKFRQRNAEPLLLPPKDYDTVSRKHGHLDGAANRKSLQKKIVGEAGLWDDSSSTSKQSHNSTTSVDSAHGVSEGGSQRNSGSSPQQEQESPPSPAVVAEVRSPRWSPKTYNSRSSSHSDRNSDELNNDDGIIPITPRWKEGREQYRPPSQHTSAHSSPSNTLMSRGSRHSASPVSSPSGTLDRTPYPQNNIRKQKALSVNAIQPNSPQVHRLVRRIASDEGYAEGYSPVSPTDPRDFPEAFYLDSPRTRLDPAFRRSRELYSPDPGRGQGQFLGTPPSPFHPAHFDDPMSHSMPDAVFREILEQRSNRNATPQRSHENEKHKRKDSDKHKDKDKQKDKHKDKDKNKEKHKDKSDKKDKIKPHHQHSRSMEETRTPEPPPDYDVTLRIPRMVREAPKLPTFDHYR